MKNFKEVIFYFLVFLSLILMFMNYILTGLAIMLFVTPFFSTPQNKKKKKPRPGKWGWALIKIRTVFSACIFLSIVVLLFLAPTKYNIMLPLFFIAVIIIPFRIKGNRRVYHFED